MGEDGAAASSGFQGRPPLPGFSSNFDQIQMETIYRDICDSENEYLRERAENPPQVTQKLGKMGQFHVVSHRSYVEAKPSRAASLVSSASAASRRSARSSSSSAAAAAAANLLAPRPPSGASRASASRAGGASRAARSEAGRSKASSSAAARSTRSSSAAAARTMSQIVEEDLDNWVFPKYALTKYSQPHMTAHERCPEGCRTAQNLQRSLSLPQNFHGRR